MTPQDLLFALEEGVRCRDLAFVIGELAGNPKALDFTASRRLTLAAEKHGVPLMLVRLDAARDLSSARMRWHVRSAPSPTPKWNAFAPGAPAWHAELFRSRAHAPGEWILRDDGHILAADRLAAAQRTDTPDPVGLAFAARGRSLAAG
jgi:protein ImuA